MSLCTYLLSQLILLFTPSTYHWTSCHISSLHFQDGDRYLKRITNSSTYYHYKFSTLTYEPKHTSNKSSITASSILAFSNDFVADINIIREHKIERLAHRCCYLVTTIISHPPTHKQIYECIDSVCVCVCVCVFGGEMMIWY